MNKYFRPLKHFDKYGIKIQYKNKVEEIENKVIIVNTYCLAKEIEHDIRFLDNYVLEEEYKKAVLKIQTLSYQLVDIAIAEDMKSLNFVNIYPLMVKYLVKE